MIQFSALDNDTAVSQDSTPTSLCPKEHACAVQQPLQMRNEWIERLAVQLRLAGLTRGDVVERTVALLTEAGVEENQVWLV